MHNVQNREKGKIKDVARIHGGHPEVISEDACVRKAEVSLRCTFAFDSSVLPERQPRFVNKQDQLGIYAWPCLSAK